MPRLLAPPLLVVLPLSCATPGAQPTDMTEKGADDMEMCPLGLKGITATAYKTPSSSRRTTPLSRCSSSILHASTRTEAAYG